MTLKVRIDLEIPDERVDEVVSRAEHLGFCRGGDEDRPFTDRDAREAVRYLALVSSRLQAFSRGPWRRERG